MNLWISGSVLLCFVAFFFFFVVLLREFFWMILLICTFLFPPSRRCPFRRVRARIRILWWAAWFFFSSLLIFACKRLCVKFYGDNDKETRCFSYFEFLTFFFMRKLSHWFAQKTYKTTYIHAYTHDLTVHPLAPSGAGPEQPQRHHRHLLCHVDSPRW